jgi:RNA polymerase sigma-70 factor (ECF subfamily)
VSSQEQVFLTLVRDNDARLRRICRVYARDADEQQDLHQEILVQVWRSLPSFAGGSSAGTWLYRVALNTALAYARRSSQRSARRETTLLDDYDAQSSDIPADEQLEHAERMRSVYDAVARLDPIDKMLVTMHLDDKSYHEMAEVLGISESNVGVKLHRIKKALAAWLAKETM